MSPDTERDWRLYADDIIQACGKVRRFISGMNYDSFIADERTCDAVIRNIEIIGEAAKKIPDEARAMAPEIPWRLVTDMRNLLAHGYFSVSLLVVWDTATTQIEPLEAALGRILSRLSGT
jgi:uncharacterized protein with HEPN domain